MCYCFSQRLTNDWQEEHIFVFVVVFCRRCVSLKICSLRKKIVKLILVVVLPGANFVGGGRKFVQINNFIASTDGPCLWEPSGKGCDCLVRSRRWPWSEVSRKFKGFYRVLFHPEFCNRNTQNGWSAIQSSVVVFGDCVARGDSNRTGQCFGERLVRVVGIRYEFYNRL